MCNEFIWQIWRYSSMDYRYIVEEITCGVKVIQQDFGVRAGKRPESTCWQGSKAECVTTEHAVTKWKQRKVYQR